jgi:glycosyltransferase involved in cell wall biosynthesis
LRVAFVHDWLVTYRGGEKVLDALLALYPDAPIYTLFYDREAMPASIQARDIWVPPVANALRKGRKLMLPLLPRMIESIPLQEYDLLISTSSCVAKGAIKGKHARHLCYLHSPMRYIWDQQDEYLAGVAHIPGAAWGIKALTPGLRRWDVESAQRVDRFVVNSTFVGERARKYYDRESVVVPPPIELDRFQPRSSTSARGGYFLAAGALVSYKRFDLAIAAAEQSGKRLVIAGAGPMEAALRRRAGTNVTFEIGPSDERFETLLAEAEALLFPGVEDFGMIAIEAMASGTPVIAYREGGARDFIEPGTTGVFFDQPTAESLAAVLREFAPTRFDAQALNRYAARYGRESFLARMQAEITQLLKEPPV